MRLAGPLDEEQQNNVRMQWFQHLRDTGRLHPAMCPGVWSDALQLGADYAEYMSMAAFVAAVVQNDENAKLLGLPKVPGSGSRMPECNWTGCALGGRAERLDLVLQSQWTVLGGSLYQDLEALRDAAEVDVEEAEGATANVACDTVLRRHLPEEAHRAVVWAFCPGACQHSDTNSQGRTYLEMPRRCKEVQTQGASGQEGGGSGFLRYELLGPCGILEGFQQAADAKQDTHAAQLLRRCGWDRVHEENHYECASFLKADTFKKVPPAGASDIQKQKHERELELTEQWAAWTAKRTCGRKRAAPDDATGGGGGSSSTPKKSRKGAGGRAAVKTEAGGSGVSEQDLQDLCLCRILSSRVERRAVSQAGTSGLARSTETEDACTCKL